jgi:adenylate cyclase class 2
MSQGAHETEIKLAAPDVKTARRLLREGGFRIARRRVFEANVVYDTTSPSLRPTGRLLRVRQADRTSILTYKGPPLPSSKYKSREEIEVDVSDAHAIGTVFERLGYQPVSRYEKYRTEYRDASGRGVATIDETPIGVFMDLEGPPAWIDRTARRLGFKDKDYITMSYSALYIAWCQREGIKPSNMIFPGIPSTARRSPSKD